MTIALAYLLGTLSTALFFHVRETFLAKRKGTK